MTRDRRLSAKLFLAAAFIFMVAALICQAVIDGNWPKALWSMGMLCAVYSFIIALVGARQS